MALIGAKKALAATKAPCNRFCATAKTRRRNSEALNIIEHTGQGQGSFSVDLSGSGIQLYSVECGPRFAATQEAGMVGYITLSG